MSIRSQPAHAPVIRVMGLMVDVATMKRTPATRHQTLLDGLNAVVGTNQALLYVADRRRPPGEPPFVHRICKLGCVFTPK